MLLRRVIEHVKAQNWTAVGLDFLIVVTGVFIGIQVANWNAERARDTQEDVLMGRLFADVEQMKVAAGTEDERLRERLGNVAVGLNALQSCALSKLDKRAFDSALIVHQIMPRLLVIRATYDELVTSGALARIDDPELKEHIATTFATAESIQEVIDYFSSDLGRASDIIWRKVSFSIALENTQQLDDMDADDIESLSQSVDYDFNTLCSDIVFRNAMLEVLDSFSDRLGANDFFIGQLTELQQMLRRRSGVST